MIKTFGQLGMCLGEVLVVHSRSLLEQLSPWTVLCVGTSAAVTAWSLFHKWSQAHNDDPARWRQFGLPSQNCGIVD
jgi:hypothetical protein